MRFKPCWMIGAVALTTQAATQQNEPPLPPTEIKQVMTTVADTGDSVRMYALQIEKSWTDSSIHLTGKVRLVVGKLSASGSHAIVITADEVTLNERTGEIVPSGNVRIALYPSH